MFAKTLDTRTLAALKKVAALPDFANGGFYLAGGTALTLHYGHRQSIDLDFFTETAFDVEVWAARLVAEGAQINATGAGTVHALVKDVKCSFFVYAYPLVAPLTAWNGVRMASAEDVACMKVVAISQRAEKKDFFDLLEILRHIEPARLRDLLLRKYGARRINCHHILRSLFYFDDAEESPDPVSLRGLSWADVKRELQVLEPAVSAALLG